MRFTLEDLKSVRLLNGLPEAPLVWLGDHGVRIELAAGERMFSRGQPADFMFIVVTGTIQRFEEIGGQWILVATTSQGEVTGMLPYSRMTHYPGYGVAVEASSILRVAKDDFDSMLAISHELGQRLVAEMSNRVRGDVRLEQQRDKMIALGRLSAGLAHELNNPAAAITRTVANLAEELASRTSLMALMARNGMDQTVAGAMEHLTGLVRERERPALSPIEHSEREEAIVDWLEDHSVGDPWEVASVLTDAGLLVDDLDAFVGTVPEAFRSPVVAWVAGNIEVNRMVAEITAAAGRISDLVSSVKNYSHMDRSSEHKPTDVREGLDNTLTMFGHKLKSRNIDLSRNYLSDLPTIPANAGELNQVWTNLIDNAIDAMTDGGDLRIEADNDEIGVAVRIIDNGKGIPEEIRQRIFDPFFTTKDVGKGTGLGLDIARRIVRTHQGQIEVRSQPGRTEMLVRLPATRREETG